MDLMPPRRLAADILSAGLLALLAACAASRTSGRYLLGQIGDLSSRALEREAGALSATIDLVDTRPGDRSGERPERSRLHRRSLHRIDARR